MDDLSKQFKAIVDEIRRLSKRIQELEVAPKMKTNGHIIKDETSSLAQRAALDFQGGGVTATDDAINDKTIVTVPAGAPVNHNILSTTHGDTLAAALVQGDVLFVNATPKLTRLPAGGLNTVLQMGAALPQWSTQTITLTGSLTVSAPATVSGTNTGDVSLAVNHGLSLAGQVLAMGTPSTLTSSTTNAVTTTTHTHAITASPALLGNGTSQYQVIVTGANPYPPGYSGFLLDGTTGGKTVFAVTNTKVLTLTATDSYNLAIPASGTVALLATANVFTATQTISNTAPIFVMTDTTASAKSLTIAVDANMADLRESAGAAGSLLTLDLTNTRVGIGRASPTTKLDVNGVITAAYNQGFALDQSVFLLKTISADVQYFVNQLYTGGHKFTTNTGFFNNNANLVSIFTSFAPTSGTGTFTDLLLNPTINQTGGANGITRGLYIIPTLTAAADWRSIEVARGNVMLNTLAGLTSIGASTSTAKLTVGGVAETIRVVGTGTSGDASVGYISFYDSDNTTRRGYFGDGSASNDDIYFYADTGHMNFGAGAVNGMFIENTTNNIGINVTAFGTSAVHVLAIKGSTAPTTAPADIVQLWSEDINGAAGKAGLHMMAESGTDKLIVVGVIIKIDAGDPAQVHEGLMCINTSDNNIKMYGDAGWRTLVTW